MYPGFINARTTIGIGEPGVRGYDDVSEMLEFNPQLRTRMTYHSESDAIAVARANGITTVAVAPSGGILSGEVPVMHLVGWTWEEATLKGNAGIAFNFPALGGGGGRGGRGGAPGADRTFDDIRRDRDRQLDRIIRLLDQARAYAVAGPDRTVDWTLEALVPVVERKLPLITNASREQDIRDAVAFAERAKVNIVLSGGTEANYQLAGQLVQAGVKIAFSTGDNTNVRLLPNNAAMSVAWGLPRDEAIKALTINAAEILGIADSVGSIETGKVANLFIAKGDPLETRTEVTHVIIQGRDVGLANKHLALYEKYIARR